MVERLEPATLQPTWRCIVCRRVYEIEDRAIECENKPIEKIALAKGPMGNVTTCDDWNVGDNILILNLDEEDGYAYGDAELKKITNTIQQGHYLYPMIGDKSINMD